MRTVVAPILTIVGGTLVAVGGAVLARVGTVLATVFGLSRDLFVVGLAVGLLTIALGALLWGRPARRRPIGVLVVLLAVVSIPFAFGGFVIGFVLTVMGGTMAIVAAPTGAPAPRAAAEGRAPPWG